MKRAKTSRGGAWSVYVLLCRGGSYYTGIAKDVEKRLESHRAGKGAAYTRSRPPKKILYREDGLSRAHALTREVQIKALTRKEKERLVRDSGVGPG